jgi:hypothetical protein
LCSALVETEQHGIGNHVPITAEDRAQIQGVNELYIGKKFEYFEQLATVYEPLNFDLEHLKVFADKLHTGIHAAVRASIYTLPQMLGDV